MILQTTTRDSRMRYLATLLQVVAVLALAACGGSNESGETADPQAADSTDSPTKSTPTSPREIAPGLTMRILEAGSGDVAEAGDTAVVHYTGWLYDETAPDNRGQKFDSSLDRGQHFRFPLGAGRVIKGWDQGVVGMQVGEVRELTIAPEMAYGERGAGNLIPPGATLVFEVELAGIEGGAAATE